MKNCKYNNLKIEELRIKKIPIEKLLISIDRLTRFKHPQIKYLRVYEEIISEYLIYPQIKKTEIENLDYALLTLICEKIINFSIEEKETEDDYTINQKIYEYETSIFATNENTKKLLKNKINYRGLIKYIPHNPVKNLAWLRELATKNDIKDQRRKLSLQYPLEKIVITEGATEEILLPEFAKLYDLDFEKEGIKLLSAGGKNQVVKLYYSLVENIKIPIYILMDKDATENLEEIKPKLRTQDRVHLLSSGEFEDLLTPELVLKTLNEELKNISIVENEIFQEQQPMTKILEEIFRDKGYHEFKKVEFAQMIKRNLATKLDLKHEVAEIINGMKKMC